MPGYELPSLLRARLEALPDGLRAHVERVRQLARDLAARHGIDPRMADLTAAAHDVARHIEPRRLLDEAGRLGIGVNEVERAEPVLLHGPVGAAWLRDEGSVTERDALEGVRWHTTAHPDLNPLARVVLLADKLDPRKLRQYPFQEQVREAALRDLDEGLSVFLDGALRQSIDAGRLVHPASVAARNALLLAKSC